MTSPIGIIGGSGLYAMAGVKDTIQIEIDTPFGKPSDPLVMGRLEGVQVAFLSRHGVGHRLTPSEVNYRANIWALKSVGCEILISVSAVGSLQDHHTPGCLRLPDQFIDHTHLRESTFFGDGLVAHVGFADPTSAWLRGKLTEAARTLDLPFDNGGTYVCMEGPAFSTRAESRLHQSWGADYIGMTQVTEAKLAREAELAFATIALVTDYDAWRDIPEAADAHDIMAVMAANVAKAEALLRSVVVAIADGPPEDEPARGALRTALMTPPGLVPAGTRERLKLFIEKYGY
ncbi:MAG: S-methyl-5'-thioadenosine phosphorylase [Acidobacteriota bacterium]|nr:S-methyl-5'-thioadenosine phosphorylase [Acidobacteriota bacterium]